VRYGAIGEKKPEKPQEDRTTGKNQANAHDTPDSLQIPCYHIETETIDTIIEDENITISDEKLINRIEQKKQYLLTKSRPRQLTDDEVKFLLFS
jgi:hypothetical protein